jgi:hypothetical protein
MVPEPRKILDRIINRQLHFVGVTIRLPDRLVAHLLPRKVIGDAIPPHEGRPSVSQRVEIGETGLLILIGDANAPGIHLEARRARDALRE